MIIKVTSTELQNNKGYRPNQNQTRFYNPTTPKRKVKEDFGIVLDRELSKLHFDKLI